MTLSVSYMGTKRQLAGTVADVVAGCPPGPLLDVFAGMCSVASTVAADRNVWCNDVQRFASETAAAFFTSRWELPPFSEIECAVEPLYARNRDALSRRFGRLLDLERCALEGRSAARILAAERAIPHVGNSAQLNAERSRIGAKALGGPYRLFSLSYAGSYFSLRQSIEIDSLRSAVDQLYLSGHFARDQHRWLVLALCQAISKVSTTTGHFAQPMTVKRSTVARHVAQRSRRVWDEWRRAINECVPVGSRSWRRGNRAYQHDALALLAELAIRGDAPAVVYADPPYTSDQYSRFYHIYETLICYDYPPSSGIGRYRDGRYASEFSLASRVSSAIEELASRCSRLGSALVLSYPVDGLLQQSASRIPKMLRRHFGHVEVAAREKHSHSSFGASKGAQSHIVTEVIYLAH
jgi:adenine-specific DNA-methyltransferase